MLSLEVIIPIIIKSIVISNAKGDVVHWYKLVHVVGHVSSLAVYVI